MRTRGDRRRTGLPVLLIALACGLSDGPPADPGGGLVPQPTPPGAPLEHAATVTVTAAGATVATPDGALSIEIPAGAVASPTDVTITRITSTAIGAVAGAYRLGPEGTTFAEPVRLTFHGPESYPTTGGIGDVGVSYQDRNGYWVRAGPVSRDRNANTVSVETHHFSDWTLTWQTGTPIAEGSIRLSQTYGVPFVADGRATLYLQSDDASQTAYVLAGTLTAPASIAVGSDVCVPDQATKSWVNTAEIDKDRGVFRWGIAVGWTLTCTSPGGAVTTRDMPAVFDTMGINLTRCLGAYDPGQFAEADFVKGAYTTDCAAEGAVRATWELRGYQVLVDPTSGLVTTEAGGTATFELALSNAPAADVTVAVSSSSPEGAATPATVVFTPSDWSTPHVVTVTGVDDFVDDGDVSYAIRTAPAASADVRYAGIDAPDVGATNLDDDVAGLTAAPGSGLVTTEAGGTATFQLSLSSQPVQDVLVTVETSDATEGTASAATLTFTPGGWNAPQTVTVTGVDDFVADGPIGYAVRVSASSADPLYQGVTASVAVTTQDDDVAELKAAPAIGLATTEAGGTTAFQVALGSEPLSDVTVSLASGDTTEGTVTPAVLTFTAADWNVPQTATVAGVDDFVADGPVMYAIALSAASADAGYAARTGAVSVTNVDDDVAGLVAAPSSGLVTTEGGGAAFFAVRLSSQPLADVVIDVASADVTEGAVAPATLTFTAATWSVAQAVTITGVDDAVADGPIAYDVRLAAVSADAGYSGRTGTVSVTSADDDVAAIAVGTPSGTTTAEAGTSVTFTVVLGSQPGADVTIPLSSSDETEGAVSPASLVFTAATWNLPQTVTVTGVDDRVADATQPYTIVLGAASSADAGYAGRDPADLAFTNTDDDVAAIAVSAPTASSTSEAGGTATFTVTLGSEPTADVTIPLASSDGTEAAVSPASLVFTAATWNVPQAVTVAGVDDRVADGPQPYAIAIGPAVSGDAGYAGRDPVDLAFTNADDDVAGIAVSAPTGTVTVETGAAVTFTVVLGSEPTADVTVPLSSSDATEGAVSPASLVFTAASWNVPQTVTVSGVDDLVADGPQPYTIVLGAAQGADAGYAGRDPADLAFTNADDDLAGVLVGAPSGIATTEAGTSVAFTLALRSQPIADVIIPLSSGDATEAAVAPAEVVFTAANWSVPRTVTVTGVDDAVDDGDQGYAVVIGAATSGDAGYAGLDPADPIFTNVDDDAAGLVASPASGLATTEAGGSAIFELSLSSQPTADVVVTLASGDATEGTVSPPSVTFTAADWSAPRTITVTGVDDAGMDGPVAYVVELAAASADPGYAGRTGAVAATNADDDVAGLLVTPAAGLQTTEAGGAATLQVALATQPTGDVVVSVASSDPTEGAVSPTSLTFTAATWNVAQPVTVTGVDDAVADGPVAYAVQLAATSADAGYAGRTGAASVTSADDDVAGFAVGAPGGTVTSEAGTSVTFTLALTSQPTSDVTLPLSSSDETEGAVSPASVTFTPADWNVVRTVTVTGVDDPAVDGDQAYVVAIGAATSADAAYQGRDPADLLFSNTDDDAAGLLATPSAGLATTEAGGSATFQLALASQPTADVVVTLATGDATEGTVSPASLTFTAADWSVARTVTVTGVDDAVADGPVAYAITLAAGSADASYAGRTGSVSATNADDDAAGIAVGAPSGVSTTEAGAQVTFTLALTSQPTADVTIPLSSSDATEATVSPASVVFTAADWDVPRTVTVTGADDLVDDGDQPFDVVIGAADGADPGYAGRDPADLVLLNADDDAAGIAVGAPSGTVTSETGTQVTFAVLLASQPTADVTLPLASSDASEGAVSPASVTFTPADWNVARVVTVTGVNDAGVDGDQAYAVAIGPASSGDAGYQGRDPADLLFTNTDDDAAGLLATPAAGLSTTEAGGSATFQLALASQPAADVVVTLASSDPAEGTVSPASLTFTAADWNGARTVTVTGVDDAFADGPVAYAVQLTAASADAGYGGRTMLVPATNADDDAAGVTVGAPSGISTTEAGAQVAFTLVLTAQPTADVTIPLSSGDPAEAAVSPATLVFTAADWDVPRTVTVTGVDDLVDDGDRVYDVVIGAAVSADPGYAGRDPADLVLLNVDDDTAAIVALPSADLTTTEAGGTATFEVTLATEPVAGVTVSVESLTPAEGTAAPATLTFTAADWSVPQTVTLTGVDDLVVDGPLPYTVRLSASGADAAYAGVAADVSATNLDDDGPPPTGLVAGG
jgi:large repetitive protein